MWERLAFRPCQKRKQTTETDYDIRGLLEEILDRDNMNRAYKRVKKNKGSHGIDGMTVDELLPFLRENSDQIKKSILEGSIICKKQERRRTCDDKCYKIY